MRFHIPNSLLIKHPFTTEKFAEVAYKPLISWRDMETTILGKHKASAMDDVDDLLPSGNTPPGPVFPSSSETGPSSDEPE